MDVGLIFQKSILLLYVVLSFTISELTVTSWNILGALLYFCANISICIKAVVVDNGLGTGKLIKGLGIIGMEERAASINGKVIVDGSKGFSVTTLLPLEQPDESSGDQNMNNLMVNG